jgi:predicted DNA-binding transcriptional regulator YafY
MNSGNHDTLVFRLSQMLLKLNSGEKLNPKNLAEEFGVNIRTIQRDINVRFSYLPLQKSKGLYYLDPSYLGKFDSKDIQHFAKLAGVAGLFPLLSKESLQSIFDERMNSSLIIKGYEYEDISDKHDQFQSITYAITSKNLISFNYKKDKLEKSYQDISPYKLINIKGIWYLAALDEGKLKTFSFSLISNVMVSDTTFKRKSSIEEKIEANEGVWLSDEKITLTLQVSSEVSKYFKRRKLVPAQVIEKEMEDGGILISSTVSHTNQILPIVKYWIPHLKIITPSSLQKEIEYQLSSYLEQN